jgi:hypothetical protein
MPEWWLQIIRNSPISSEESGARRPKPVRSTIGPVEIVGSMTSSRSK